MEKDGSWHIRQTDAGRFEEYATLREEMLELFRFCRQLLYWTLVLVVGGVAWQIGNLNQQLSNLQKNLPQGFGLSNSIFAVILLAAIFLSFLVYLSYMWHIYNIGGFIAVFWESRHNKRGLKWHRFSRNKPRARGSFIFGMMNTSTALIYSIASIASVAILWVTTPKGESFLAPWIICIFEAIALFLLMHLLGKNMRSMEKSRRLIREEKQDEIHDRYEPKYIPPNTPIG